MMASVCAVFSCSTWEKGPEYRSLHLDPICFFTRLVTPSTTTLAPYFLFVNEKMPSMAKRPLLRPFSRLRAPVQPYFHNPLGRSFRALRYIRTWVTANLRARRASGERTPAGHARAANPGRRRATEYGWCAEERASEAFSNVLKAPPNRNASAFQRARPGEWVTNTGWGMSQFQRPLGPGSIRYAGEAGHAQRCW